MKNIDKDKTKFLLLEIENLNPNFHSEKVCDSIAGSVACNDSEVFFNNNSCYVHLTTLDDGYHISSECIYTNTKKAKALIEFINKSLYLEWVSMLKFFEAYTYFNKSDCNFYNYVNGDYSRFITNNYNGNAVISYRIFVDNVGFNKSRAIKLGFYILEILQNCIEDITNNNLSSSEFINILKHNIFYKLTFLNKYYKSLFEELSLINKGMFTEVYYYQNRLTSFISQKSKDETYNILFGGLQRAEGIPAVVLANNDDLPF